MVRLILSQPKPPSEAPTKEQKAVRGPPSRKRKVEEEVELVESSKRAKVGGEMGKSSKGVESGEVKKPAGSPRKEKREREEEEGKEQVGGSKRVKIEGKKGKSSEGGTSGEVKKGASSPRKEKRKREDREEEAESSKRAKKEEDMGEGSKRAKKGRKMGKRPKGAKAGKAEVNAPAGRVPKGLTNDANSCFLNGAVQCMQRALSEPYKAGPRVPLMDAAACGVSEEELAAAAAGKRTRATRATQGKIRKALSAVSKDDFRLRPYLHNLLENLTEKKGSSASPMMFAQAFGRIVSDVNGDEPEDPETFIEGLLGRLEREERLQRQPDDSETRKTKAQTLYQGQVGKKIICSGCQHQRGYPSEPFWVVPVGLPSDKKEGVTLSECFEHTMGEEIDYACSECKHPKGSQSEFVEEAPEHLIVKIRRINNFGQKVFTKVSLPSKTFSTVNGSGDHRGAEYKLHGVLKHRGKSVEDGHYVAFVKHGEQWWRFDDHLVTAVDWAALDDNKKEQPYLLFFDRPI